MQKLPAQPCADLLAHVWAQRGGPELCWTPCAAACLAAAEPACPVSLQGRRARGTHASQTSRTLRDGQISSGLRSRAPAREDRGSWYVGKPVQLHPTRLDTLSQGSA